MSTTREHEPIPGGGFGRSSNQRGLGTMPRYSAVRWRRQVEQLHERDDQAEIPSPSPVIIASGPREEEPMALMTCRCTSAQAVKG